MPALCCVKVNPETSRLIQELAFVNGYCWSYKERMVQFFNQNYLYFWDDNFICHSQSQDKQVKLLSLEECVHFLKTKELPKPFTLKDLKSGMRVTLRNGKDYICIELTTKSYSGLSLVCPTKDSNSWLLCNGYNNNLTEKHNNEFDIMKVELLGHPYDIFYKFSDKSEVLFERSE